jgi:hypothetical protein
VRKISIFAACFGFAMLYGQTPNVTIQIVPNYKQWGWDTTIVMQNDLITMATMPAIGGRVMQYDLGSLPSIMVDSSLLGQTYVPAKNSNWYNFGGYKTWPSPQNNWPNSWPPPPKLDYGKYAYQIVSQTADSVVALVTSPVETWAAPNIQFKRRATIFPGTSRVRMEQTIINTGSPPVSWGVWSITESIVNHPGKTDTLNYWAYFPINPNSVYGSTGVNPQGTSLAWKGEVAAGVYGVQFYPTDPNGQKIFADPDKGWIAYTDRSDTVVFIRTFPIFDGEQYPDNGARVSVYVSSNSPPLYMEVEVKGPVVALAAAGGNYTFTENWWAAKVRAPVLDVDSVGAIAERLSYNSKTQSLSAIYGMFYKGTAKITFIDAQGKILTEGQSHTITPLEEFQLQDTIPIPDSAKTVEVLVYNAKTDLVGILESADVSQLITAVESKTPAIASEFRLEANYPNPFNPSTTIRYHLPQATHVDLSIYNVLGKRIQTLVRAYQAGGDYNVQWNGKVNGITAASGVYFARLSAVGIQGTNVQIQRMLLLK